MAWKPKPMKVQCPQCKATDIFAPSRDVIAFFPRCKTCGVKMKYDEKQDEQLVKKTKSAFRRWISLKNEYS